MRRDLTTRCSNATTAILAICLVAGWCVGPTASAAEVFRWVDADGVVHFSDTRPEEDEGVETLEVTERNPPGYDPAEDPYNILNQAARTNEMLARIEKEQAERETRQTMAADTWIDDDRPRSPWLYSYSSSYFAPPFYPPQRPTRPPSFQRQWNALEQNDLTGPRPASINSGEHAARVARSQALPLTGPGPRRP